MKKWTCLNCDSINDVSCVFCPKCGFPNPDTPVVAREAKPDGESSEKSLVSYAKVIYGFGIVTAAIIIAMGLTILEFPLNIYGLVVAVAIVISAAVYYYFLKVVCNVSETLKEINRKIK